MNKECVDCAALNPPDPAGASSYCGPPQMCNNCIFEQELPRALDRHDEDPTNSSQPEILEMSAYDTLQPDGTEATPEPCPHCGHDVAKLRQLNDRSFHTGRGMWLVHCGVCRARGGDSTSPAMAVQYWNRRYKPVKVGIVEDKGA